MLVKTSPEWLGFSVERRFELLRETVTPILRKHAADVRLRFFDVEFYSARVTDVWLWDARDHHAYQLLVEDLRETPFWDRYFQIVEIRDWRRECLRQELRSRGHHGIVL
jgi:hypothetical protein